MARRRGEPLGEEEKRKLNKKNFRKLLELFRYMKPYKGSFIAALFFLFLSSINVLSLPFFAGKLINVSSGYEYWIIDNINKAAVVLLVIFFFQSVFSFLRIYFLEKVNVMAMNDLRSDLYDHFMALPMHFYDSKRVGELTSRISNDVTMLRDTFSTTLAEFVRQLLTLTVGLAIIFISAPKLSLFMLATFPVILLIALFFGRLIRSYSKKIQDQLADSNTIVEETIQAIQVVKAFTNEIFEVSRYNKTLQKVIDGSLKMAVYNGAFVSFIIFGLFGAIAGVMWYGASLVQQGLLTTGDLFSFLLYTVFIGASIGGLGSFYAQIQRAIGASERILEILHQPKELENSDSHYNRDISLNADIAFEQVQFAYPSRKGSVVLDNINFIIPKGRKVALVGRSGAGKSTISSLIMRFYAPDSGKITIGGEDILAFNLSAYRKEVGIVPQEVLLFGTSIRENIAYGNTGASEEQIMEASKMAYAHDFIVGFPDGYDTLVGERGIKLSGGQKQRIAIARAILKDPSILILDEATSSLDSVSEMEVQKALERLMKGRTSIIIAHRLATIRNVDKIIFLEGGKIIEEGSYPELSSKTDGRFQELLKMQFEEEPV
jgi:ABC-type multidrug transport system fused ATPase/permease subunit